MDKFSSATCLLHSDVVTGEVPRGQGNIRKRTKKKPWNGQSRSRRFSFHNFYNFFLFFFQLFYFIIFFYTFFLPTKFTHTHNHDPRPTTFSDTRVKQSQCSQRTVIIDLMKNQLEQMVISFRRGLPYKSDAGARRLQISVSLRVIGTKSD